MIYRMVVLEADGDEVELSVDIRTSFRETGEHRSIRAISEHLGGIRLLEDGWHVIGEEGALGPMAYPEPENAIQTLLVARARLLARRLAP